MEKNPRKSKVVIRKMIPTYESSDENSDKDSIGTRICNIDISKFCPKKFFHIMFAVESDADSTILLNDLEEFSKTYEDVSSLTFISRDDILRLIEDPTDVVFPNVLKPMFLNTIEAARSSSLDEIPVEIEAQLIKLKVLEVMYRQYMAEVKRNQRRKHLDDVLNVLSKECRKKQPKSTAITNKSNASASEKKTIDKDSKKKGKQKESVVPDEEVDFTLINLEIDDGISFVDNIFKYFWFYVLKGFYNIEVLTELLQHLNVPIFSIIRVEDYVHHPSVIFDEDIEQFWNNVGESFFYNTSKYKCFENTVLMKFSPDIKKRSELRFRHFLETFQEFLHVVRTTLDIKLNHLKYLQHLRIHKIENSYRSVPAVCFKSYQESLANISLECVNEALILNGLVNEVHCISKESKLKSVETSRSLVLSTTSSRSTISNCISPIRDFRNFQRNYKPKLKEFLAHESDGLLLLIKFYEIIGRHIFEITVKSIKLFPILIYLKEFVGVPKVIKHRHDLDPSTLAEKKESKMIDHFIYLLLFNILTNETHYISNPIKYDLAENLISYDESEYWHYVQTKSLVRLHHQKTNSYNTPTTDFCWIEKLKSDVMLQEIFKALTNFEYADAEYCAEYDSMLVACHDKLDSFGLNTRMYEKVVRTPICLRDFCRYTTFAESEWLSDHQIESLQLNQPLESDFVLQEICPGAIKVKTEMKVFDEYSYLLSDTIEEENVSIFKEESDRAKRNFDYIYKDLERYPTNKNLIEHCEKAPESEQLLCYDLGTNLCKLTGAKTVFQSHDGVKVTVDNSRFLQNMEKCSVRVDSDGNSLILNSNENCVKEPYLVNVVLENDTRITFIFGKEEEVDFNSNPNQVVLQHNNSMQETVNTKTPISFQSDKHALAVDEDYFRNLQKSELFEELYFSDDKDRFVEEIQRAFEQDGKVYKLGSKLNYLDKIKPEVEIPLCNILGSHLTVDSSTDLNVFNEFTRKFVPGKNTFDLKSKYLIDFRICLPNGLFITPLCALTSKDALMIKQEYISEKPNSIIDHEELRLYTNQGFILVKKFDGSITIFRANGDTINFENYNGISENLPKKLCQCKTAEDFRKVLNKLFRNINEDYSYPISRRGHLTGKKNRVSNEKIMKVLNGFDVPYAKKSVIKFDGTQINISGQKIAQTQKFLLTSETDFQSEQTYCERSDGLKSIIDKNGGQIVIFPDKTVISSSVEIKTEFVDDFVFVILSFKYEHPNYASIEYDFDGSLKVCLNDSFVLRKNEQDDAYDLKLNENVEVLVNTEQVTLNRKCLQCSELCTCIFNIKNFVDHRWDPLEVFVEVNDSYDKNFLSDFVGNCSRNADYLDSILNKAHCDHYKDKVYKKLFLINRELTGELFWQNSLLENKDFLKNYDVQKYKMIANDKTIVECRKEIKESYCNRFLNKCESANVFQNESQSEPLYTTYRKFYKMISEKEIEETISNLDNVWSSDLNSNVLDTQSLINNLRTFKHELSKQEEINAEREYFPRESSVTAEQKVERCECIQLKLSVKQKIDQWRKECFRFRNMLKKKEMPKYFCSEFCNILK